MKFKGNFHCRYSFQESSQIAGQKPRHIFIIAKQRKVADDDRWAIFDLEEQSYASEAVGTYFEKSKPLFRFQGRFSSGNH